MRLFTAVDPTPEVYRNLTELIDRLRPLAPLRWSRPENLHVTLKFIGEFPEENLPRLRDALGKFRAQEPFPVTVRGLGFFPNERSPRVFWAGIEHTGELARLAADMEEACSKLGIARERRSYSPHLTLARIPEGARLDRLRDEIRELNADFGGFTATALYLYQSRLAPGGSVYTRLEEFPFDRNFS
jgi:2'-5' RNA ligase